MPLVVLAVAQFFNQHIVSVWNNLPHNTVDFHFSTLTSFKKSISNVDYSDFLKFFRSNFMTLYFTVYMSLVPFNNLIYN